MSSAEVSSEPSSLRRISPPARLRPRRQSRPARRPPARRPPVAARRSCVLCGPRRAGAGHGRPPGGAGALRPAAALFRLGAVAPQRLGDLTPPLEAAVFGRRQGLHSRLDALAVAADAQRVASAVEAPVLRVVVGVGQLLRLSGDDAQARTAGVSSSQPSRSRRRRRTATRSPDGPASDSALG